MEKTYRIKPLEFPEIKPLSEIKMEEYYNIFIHTTFGSFSITAYNPEDAPFEYSVRWGFDDSESHYGQARFGTAGECKTFIQSDYERRLLPALIEQ